ncbi:MAG: alpha/beta fold hydrolase [Bacteroidales bacterium]|nr:alpha/beta fold hydrolase [Bacteroidales bacterium]
MFQKLHKLLCLPTGLILILCALNSCAFNRAFFKKEPVLIDLPDSVNVEFITNTNRSGEILSAAFFKPAGEAKATIFMLKGNSGDISSWYNIISVLLKNNYQVFTFDYEGMGESEGRASHRNVLTDSQLFLKQVKKRSDVKNKKLILWGFSFGGNLAVKLAHNNPGVFDLMVLEGAFTSQRAVSLIKMPKILKPFVFFMARSPYSSLKLLPKAENLPLLVVHSVEDKEIPFRMGLKLYNNANQPKMFFEVLGNHCQALLLYEEEYMKKIDKLLLPG